MMSTADGTNSPVQVHKHLPQIEKKKKNMKERGRDRGGEQGRGNKRVSRRGRGIFTLVKLAC